MAIKIGGGILIDDSDTNPKNHKNGLTHTNAPDSDSDSEGTKAAKDVVKKEQDAKDFQLVLQLVGEGGNHTGGFYKQSTVEALDKGSYQYMSKEETGAALDLDDVKVFNAIEALEDLQSTKTGWLSANAINIPTEYRISFLPKEAEGRINYMSSNHQYLSSLFLRDESKKNEGGKNKSRKHGSKWKGLLDTITGKPELASEMFGSISAHEYTLWAVTVGNHFVTIVLHMQEDGKENHDTVTQVAVIDPAQDSKTEEFVRTRLKHIMKALAYNYDPSVRRVWTPKQKDSWSCGLSTANVLKVMIQRISDQYLSGGDGYSETLWRPFRPYLNLDELRGELTGLAAEVLKRRTGYRSRTLVGMVNLVKEHSDGIEKDVSHWGDPEKLRPSETKPMTQTAPKTFDFHTLNSSISTAVKPPKNIATENRAVASGNKKRKADENGIVHIESSKTPTRANGRLAKKRKTGEPTYFG
ncbi:hypothetical protein BJ170DRAFT_729209 [Xylariales sp. AK1849]|nr:hypothetical protein BJ170DRAFT_729209 [Xylariales sp. AK1849]